jgi:mannosyl-3-phosphoglycerate phosphatase
MFKENKGSSQREEQHTQIPLAVISDIDGSFMNQGSFDYAEAIPAVRKLLSSGGLLSWITSKTQAEVEALNTEIQKAYPDIVLSHSPHVIENGAGIVVPKTFLPFSPHVFSSQEGIAKDRETQWFVELATPVHVVREGLREAKSKAGVHIETLEDMSSERFHEITKLSIEKSRLALQRRYQEGFLFQVPPSSHHIQALEQLLEEKKLRLTRGGIFWQVTGGADKGKGVRVLKTLLSQKYGQIITIGLGDSPDGDILFLNECDYGILIKNPATKEHTTEIPPTLIQTSLEGSQGWHEGIQYLLDLKEQGSLTHELRNEVEKGSGRMKK